MELLLLIWLGVAIGCGAIASNKGRSGFGWFLIGLIGGVIALIVVAVLPKAMSYLDTPEGQLQSGTAKKCPECAELVQSEARVCRHCGHRFEALAI